MAPHRAIPRRPAGETALRVGARVSVTVSEGPGTRYALWLQGCSIRCPGCCNPHLFDARGGTRIPVRRLLSEIRQVSGRIEGVTFLGGEPFEQATGLALLARRVRQLGLSVTVFSGHTLAELRASTRPGVRRLLASTDLLVDGRYDASRPDTSRLWVGSTNQRFHYLSHRYDPRIETPVAGEPLRTVEVRLTPEGRVLANGWPDLRGVVRGDAPA